ncbi:hypothetical protein [Krasilnikovia cinnamomea]|uniref:hypothetical protein n=1 Tax=Krasilnikovia cinnamomea TaxID=349313 RepID=UPI001F5F3F56|nr:hypothetical protein [Krasilnikovia cinnamomea]
METMPPREVPGYAEAFAAGRIRQVPATPPRLAVFPTARAVLQTHIAVAVIGILAMVMIAKIIGWLTGEGAVFGVAMGLLSTLAFVMYFRRGTRIGERLIAEFRHGYCTFELSLGGFWIGGHGNWGEMGPGWDFRSLWLLDGSTGAVKRSPVPGGDPPGMYPSPHRPGQWELWTGSQWYGIYESPPDDGPVQTA